MTRILVTGAAGMIGYHLAARLLADGHEIRGCDSFTSYYDIALKEARSASLASRFGFATDRVDLCDGPSFSDYYAVFKPEIVVHLAAQPGVRQGLEAPHQYVDSNLVGFTNVLDMCRRMPPRHLLYASSSSVYGANTVLPWSEEQPTEHPVSLYAATKKANELMAHSYSHITGVAMTGIRFFTVYGEWGRPDMAPYKFASAVRAGKEITVYNHGKMSRDFTYVGDAVEALVRMMAVVPDRQSAGLQGISPVAPHRVINIGSGRPIHISDFIALVEKVVDRKARILYAARAAGDVVDSFASTQRLQELTGYVPDTPFETGLSKLCQWLDIYESSARRAMTSS